jgi:hypothetical protein
MLGLQSVLGLNIEYQSWIQVRARDLGQVLALKIEYQSWIQQLKGFHLGQALYPTH